MSPESRQIYPLLLLNTIALSMDWVLWIRITTQLEPFSWFISQILYPISVAASLWPVVGVLHFRGEIEEGNRNFPKWIFLMLAAMGTTMNYGMAIFSGLLDGTLQAVLAKASTVIVMTQSRLILGTQYRYTHIAASLMMVGAAAIGSIPSIENTQPKAQGEERSTGDTVVGLILFAVTMAIPKRVCEEKYSKSADLHPVFFRAWEILIQVGLAVVLLPLAFVQVVPTQKPPTFNGLGIYLQSAMGCLAGTEQPDYPEAECSEAGLLWIVFLVANVTNDVSSIAISKYGSAALGEMWSSLTMLVTVGLMQWPWLTGKPDQPISVYMLVSLLVIVVGLGLYSWYPEIRYQASGTDQETLSIDQKPKGEQEDPSSLSDALLQDV